MAAPPERIWELISDVTKIGQYSPETFEAEWLDGADRPGRRRPVPRPREAKREGPRLLDDLHGDDQRSRQEFTFGVGSADKPLNVWSYKMEPAATAPT